MVNQMQCAASVTNCWIVANKATRSGITRTTAEADAPDLLGSARDGSFHRLLVKRTAHRNDAVNAVGEAAVRAREEIR
jgi:hypothetical protein